MQGTVGVRRVAKNMTKRSGGYKTLNKKSHYFGVVVGDVAVERRPSGYLI